MILEMDVKDIKYQDGLNYFVSSVNLEEIKVKIDAYTRELDILESKKFKLDMDKFSEQMMIFQSITERCSSIFWDLRNIKRRYETIFDKVVFLRIREEDIQIAKLTQPEKKHMAELDLLKYIEVLNNLDSTIDRVAMFKESYKQKHDTLSRVFSYLQYKTQLKEV